MGTIQSVEVQTNKSGFFKVGLICPNKGIPISRIEQRQVESKDGAVYTAYDMYNYDDDIMVTVENCPVIVTFKNSI
jgi:hypothetical protein